jgi:hypothetical protein
MEAHLGVLFRFGMANLLDGFEAGFEQLPMDPQR